MGREQNHSITLVPDPAAFLLGIFAHATFLAHWQRMTLTNETRL